MKFAVDKEKAIEALVYIADKLGLVGRFHAGKIVYFADLDHLRKYGRPITGDSFVAMDHGPVPSFGYDVLKGNVADADKPLIEGALEQIPSEQHPVYRAVRPPKLSYFSKTDLASLDAAIEHYGKWTFGQISDETHLHKAWAVAALNASMSFDVMLEGADAAVIEEAEQFANYGVL